MSLVQYQQSTASAVDLDGIAMCT